MSGPYGHRRARGEGEGRAVDVELAKSEPRGEAFAFRNLISIEISPAQVNLDSSKTAVWTLNMKSPEINIVV